MIKKSFNSILYTGAAVRTNTEGLQDIFGIVRVPRSYGFLDLLIGNTFTNANVHSFPSLRGLVYICSAYLTIVLVNIILFGFFNTKTRS